MLAIDTRRFALRIDGEVRVGEHAGLAQAVSTLARGARVDVVAAGDAAVHWLQAVPQSVASLTELRQAAAARCAQLFAGKAADWRVIGDWRVDRAFVCAGVPKVLAAAVDDALSTRASKPRWTTAVNSALARRATTDQDGWHCLRTPTTLVTWHKTRGAVDGIATLRTDPGEDEATVRGRAQSHMALEAARHGWPDAGEAGWTIAATGECEAEAALHVAGAGAPRAAPVRMVAGAVLVAAVAAIGALAIEARSNVEAIAAAEARLAALQPRPVAKPSRGAEAATRQQREALETAARQLNTPWSQLLDALEGSLPEDVALVSVERDSATGRVRLQAEAKSLDTLVAYVATLRHVPLFANVALLKHETNEQDANRPVRLVMEAEFAARGLKE